MLGGHLLHGGDYNPEQWLEEISYYIFQRYGG